MARKGVRLLEMCCNQAWDGMSRLWWLMGGGTLRGRSQVTVTTETEEQYSVVYYVSTRARVQCR